MQFTDWLLEANVQEWISHLRNIDTSFGLLVIGETGADKSTLVNNLLGRKAAKEGYGVEPTTSTITCYEEVIQGVPVQLYDTPGLGESRAERDYKYLGEIQKLISTDSIHLVIKMAETRLRRGIIRNFQQYTHIGIDWKRTVIALTFADEVPVPSELKNQADFDKGAYFDSKVAEWRQNIRRALVKDVQLIVQEVEQINISPATADHEGLLPNGKAWFIPF